MLGRHKLILDYHSELFPALRPYADGQFWNISKHTIVPDAVYVFCREHVNKYNHEIQQLAASGQVTVVIDNAAEGSETLATWCFTKGLIHLIEQRKILLVGGGDMDATMWPYMSYEYFLPKIFDFTENIATGAKIKEFFQIVDKPYKFLFLNGRQRSHRKYLLERFAMSGLLDQSLWTNLDTNLILVQSLPQARWQNFNNIESIRIHLFDQGQDLMDRPIDLHYLPEAYEHRDFRKKIGSPVDQSGFAKKLLFGNTWGDAVVDESAYRDTYFSLVTETVFNYPYSFRTEKIWKPIAVGHPFIAVANTGFYRDLRKLGFKTFGHLIDESFDTIENSQDRIERIAQVVENLCQQDLASFYKECYNICKYNQEHYVEYRQRVPREVPDQFLNFINQYR